MYIFSICRNGREESNSFKQIVFNCERDSRATSDIKAALCASASVLY